MVADSYADNIRQLVRTFRNNNPMWTKVTVIVVEKAMNEVHVLREAFPDANIVLCQFHVIKRFRGELPRRGVPTCQKDDAMTYISRMMYAKTEAEYKQYLTDVLSWYGPEHEFCVYFLKNWDTNYSMWCTYHRLVLPHLGNTTSNRLESNWHKMKDVMHRRLTLTQCVSKMIIMQKNRMNKLTLKLVRQGLKTQQGHPETTFFDSVVNRMSKDATYLLF